MAAPFSDSASIQDRVEDKIQLSSAIADQILNKETFAASAHQHFAEWDKDKNDSLSRTELSDVFNSSTVSYEERATASILSENYSLFRKLCTSELQEDPNRKSYTRAGYQFLESEFGNDRVTNGISIADLDVLSKLVSKNGQQRFLDAAETREKQQLGHDALLTGVNGTLALLTLARVLAPGPVRMLTGAALGVSSFATGMSSGAMFDATQKNDLKLLEMQFKNRKAMLDSLDVPRL